MSVVYLRSWNLDCGKQAATARSSPLNGRALHQVVDDTVVVNGVADRLATSLFETGPPGSSWVCIARYSMASDGPEMSWRRFSSS